MAESEYRNVKLRRRVFELLERRLMPGEDVSDAVERIITIDDEVRERVRALFQALHVPNKRKEGT